jgi:hypothetical protein
MICRDCRKEVPDRMFGYCKSCAKKRGAEQKEALMITEKEMMFIKAWKKKENAIEKACPAWLLEALNDEMKDSGLEDFFHALSIPKWDQFVDALYDVKDGSMSILDFAREVNSAMKEAEGEKQEVIA